MRPRLLDGQSLALWAPSKQDIGEGPVGACVGPHLGEYGAVAISADSINDRCLEDTFSAWRMFSELEREEERARCF